MLPKLCYVLPEYRADDKTHYYHVQELIRAVSKNFEIFLIVEKGQNPKSAFPKIKSHKSFFSFQPFRFLDIFFTILYARISGYKDFYIHYSFTSAILASLIVKIFGGRTFYWNCGEPWKYKRNFLRNLFETLAYHMVTYQVTGGESLIDGYSKYYKIPSSKIKIMPNWINLSRFSSNENKNEIKDKLNIQKNNKVVLFVHRLSERKGANMVLPVASLVLSKMPNTTFIVVGEGPDKEKMEQEIRKDVLLSKRIRLVGSVPNENIKKYFIASDVFFMPSQEEGFPKVILESMALGIPYVSTNVGAVYSVTPNILHNYVLKSASPDNFSSKLIELLNIGEKEKINMSSTLKEFVERYDISRGAERFRSLILDKKI